MLTGASTAPSFYDNFLRHSICAPQKLAWVVPATELYLSSQRNTTNGWSVTPRMLAGAGLGLYSVYIRCVQFSPSFRRTPIKHAFRYQCHAALGKRFTIGLSTYKSKRLPLVTGGPYAIVRHPSYTAIIMAMWRYVGLFRNLWQHVNSHGHNSLSLVVLDPTSSISSVTGTWW